MRYAEIDLPSPNRAAAPAHERLGVCFHHTEQSLADTLACMRDPVRRVSYHVVIDLDGTRTRLVPDEEIAWHAGVSSFRGREHCNAFLLGLSFVGDTRVAPLAEAQIGSALEWLAARWAPLGWTVDWMTDHRQIAPGRKEDLAPAEWQRLRAAIAGRFGERTTGVAFD